MHQSIYRIFKKYRNKKEEEEKSTRKKKRARKQFHFLCTLLHLDFIMTMPIKPLGHLFGAEVMCEHFSISLPSVILLNYILHYVSVVSWHRKYLLNLTKQNHTCISTFEDITSACWNLVIYSLSAHRFKSPLGKETKLSDLSFLMELFQI